jgi:hypothetical protein
MEEKYWRVLDPANRRVLKVPDSAIVHAAPRTVEIDVATFQLFRSSVTMNVTNLVKFLSKVCKTNICSDAMGSLNVRGANVWFSRIVIKVPTSHEICQWAKWVFGARHFRELIDHDANTSTVLLGAEFLWLWSPNKMRHTAEVRSTNRTRCQCSSCTVRFNQAFDNFPPCIVDDVVDADEVPSLIADTEELSAAETTPAELLYLMLTTDTYGQLTHDAKRCPITFDGGTHPNWLKKAELTRDETQAGHLERAQKVSHMLNVSVFDAGELVLKYNAARSGLPMSNEATHRCRKRLTQAAERIGMDVSVWTPGALVDEEQRVMHRVANTACFATHVLEQFSQRGSEDGVGPLGGRNNAIDVELQRSRPRAVSSALLRDAEGQRSPHFANSPICIAEAGPEPPALPYFDRFSARLLAQPSMQPARRRQRLAHRSNRPASADDGLWLPSELWEVIFGLAADDALTNPVANQFHSETLKLASVNKLARNALYECAEAKLKPAIDAVASFVGYDDGSGPASPSVHRVYDFLGCCDELRLSTVSMMQLCMPSTVLWFQDQKHESARQSFRLVHLERKKRAAALQDYAQVSARRGNLGRAEVMQLTTDHRNSLPTVSLARKPRVSRIRLDADPAHAPKTHALLHALEHQLSA